MKISRDLECKLTSQFMQIIVSNVSTEVSWLSVTRAQLPTTKVASKISPIQMEHGFVPIVLKANKFFIKILSGQRWESVLYSYYRFWRVLWKIRKLTKFKIGQYRWWPSEVIHPTSIPPNLERMNHGPGEFVIRFLGTNEYNWLTQRRVFYYRVSLLQEVDW